MTCKPGYFSLGGETYCLSMILFAKNRKRLINGLRAHDDFQPGMLIFMKGGERTTHYSTSTETLFRQESYFNWCFGVMEPGCYGTINVDTGKSVLIIPRTPSTQMTRVLEIHPASYFKDKYGVDDCCYIDEVPILLKSNDPSAILILRGTDRQSGLPMLEPEAGILKGYEVNDELIFPTITSLRVIKTSDEIDLMRYVCEVASRAHKEVMRRVRPGWYEFQAESLFKHCAYIFGGCRNDAYVGKVTSGQASYALDYGNSTSPNNKKISDDEICVFSMGTEYYCYCSVVTCTFPVSGKFNRYQKNIYSIALKVRKAVLVAMKPGVSWVNMHILAERTILTELLRLKLLLGDVDELMDLRIASSFMPHGLGHFVGLDQFDVGGYLQGHAPRREEKGLNTLATSRILRAGMVITVAPAIYFNLKLMDQALSDPQISMHFNEKELANYFLFGGVRIEDTVAVTAGGVEVLTKVPREIADIEILMAEGQRMDHAPSVLPTPRNNKRFRSEFSMI